MYNIETRASGINVVMYAIIFTHNVKVEKYIAVMFSKLVLKLYRPIGLDADFREIHEKRLVWLVAL